MSTTFAAVLYIESIGCLWCTLYELRKKVQSDIVDRYEVIYQNYVTLNNTLQRRRKMLQSGMARLGGKGVRGVPQLLRLGGQSPSRQRFLRILSAKDELSLHLITIPKWNCISYTVM